MKKLFVPILTFILLTCCASVKSSKEKIIWVNSSTTPCQGVAQQNCLLVKFNEASDWTLFYDSIEGFTHEEGFVYKLAVKEENLNTENLPADASSKKYTLVKVLSKEKDKRAVLNKTWTLTHFEEKKLENTSKFPTLKIEVFTNKVFGKGSCNNFFGALETLTDKDFILKNNLGATKMFCDDNNLEYNYFTHLRNIKSYKIKENILYLYDKNNEEKLRFK